MYKALLSAPLVHWLMYSLQAPWHRDAITISTLQMKKLRLSDLPKITQLVTGLDSNMAPKLQFLTTGLCFPWGKEKTGVWWAVQWAKRQDGPGPLILNALPSCKEQAVFFSFLVVKFKALRGHSLLVPLFYIFWDHFQGLHPEPGSPPWQQPSTALLGPRLHLTFWTLWFPALTLWDLLLPEPPPDDSMLP